MNIQARIEEGGGGGAQSKASAFYKRAKTCHSKSGKDNFEYNSFPRKILEITLGADKSCKRLS